MVATPIMGWRAGLVWGGTLAAAALLLLTVAIVNGGPIVYPDSFAYLIDGERIVRLTAPYAVRPTFYGVAVWVLHRGSWFWGALFVQALIVAHVLWLTMRAIGGWARPGRFLLLVAALVVATPVAWHVAHLLPDIFIAVLILMLFLLGFCADTLSRGERAYVTLVAAASVSFHLTAVPDAAAILAGTSVWWAFGDRSIVRPSLVAVPIALGLALALGFNGLVWHRITLTPNSPPSLLARLLADGPGRDFLDARCPVIDFELCHYRDRLPATEDGFMWGMLRSIPVADGKRIKAEADAIVVGAVRLFPLQVLGHMVANSARQAVTFQSETQLSPAEWARVQQDDSALAQATRNTLQGRGWFERPNLNAINGVHEVVVGLSLLAACGMLVFRERLGGRATALLAIVLLALAANAFVAGALGGVFARYEGRVIWLLPFAVVGVISALPALWPRRTRSRTGSTPR